ncbi:hypothetical protein ACO0M4_14600 [Streptomyces sp. RGM 3693]|uniref:hypothetical protein n=1 Tax=Streptomyces sp. RGM 3693 TaxID=3413284 RepID=UPI003D28AE7A
MRTRSRRARTAARGRAVRHTARPHPTAAGYRRPAALCALLWLIISVIAHHNLPGTALPMSSMGQPATVRESAVRPPAALPTAVTAAVHPQHEHHDSGAHCSSYDVRSEQFVSPPPLLDHARAPRPAAPSWPGSRPAGGPSPPDSATLSVLRI